MTDKTEWRAESLESLGLPGLWCVYAGKQLIVTGLDKPTALKIAAVNEMEAALDDATFQCWSCKGRGGFGGINTFTKCVVCKDWRAALAKARGEG